MSGLGRWVGRLLLRFSAPLRSLRSVPLLGTIVHRVSHSVLSSDEKVWTRVQGGEGNGLWLELNPRTGHNYLRGDVEPAVQSVLAEVLKEGMVFYDLGANIGLFSLIAARLVGKSGKVFSFEPDPETASRLRRNVERNGFNNITVVEAGIWSVSGPVNFVPADDSSPDRGVGRFARVEGAAAGIPIPCIALDEFVLRMPPPYLIKCDVEGAEVEVFRGAERLLASRRPLIICETHPETEGMELKEHFVQLGYTLKSLDELHFLFLVEE
jgi:FkbM family methyltransferase